MTDKEKLENIKTEYEYNHGNTDWEVIALRRNDLEWLIEQADRMQKLDAYVEESSKKSVELNLFLQERGKSEYLGLHVVDAIMKYVLELEDTLEQDNRQAVLESLHEENKWLKDKMEGLENRIAGMDFAREYQSSWYTKDWKKEIMNKEWLEDIIMWHEGDVDLHEFQIDWLIEQAERVQELEENLRVKDSTIKVMDSMSLHREDKLMSALQSKSSYRKQRNKLEKKVDELEQKLKQCYKVLEFYADSNNYEEIDQYMSNINVDSGSRARRELEANEDE